MIKFTHKHAHTFSIPLKDCIELKINGTKSMQFEWQHTDNNILI